MQAAGNDSAGKGAGGADADQITAGSNGIRKGSYYVISFDTTF